MDCDDGDRETHPSQSNYFAQPRGAGGYDYNCDGQEARQNTKYYDPLVFNCDSGWDSLVPTCGQLATWMSCDYNYFVIPVQCVCNSTARVQACR